VAEDLLGLGKLTEQLADLLKPLLVPPAQEVGQLFSDWIRNRRIIQTLKRLQEVRKRLAISGIQPQPVPLKILYPILEGCSLEEDNSDLTPKWVGLLASAAAGNTIHASYPKILAELTPTEAKMLDALYERNLQYGPNAIESSVEPKELNSKSDLSPEQLDIAVVNLGRLGLCTIPVTLNGVSVRLDGVIVSETKVKLTSLGENFVASCRGPQKPTS
jgi:hypothetical protein